MKKLFAMILVTLMMVGVAHAELAYTGARTETFTVEGKNGEEVALTYYYVTLTSGDTGASFELEVSAEEYKPIEKAVQKAEAKSAKEKKKEERGGWMANAKAIATFWNPDD